MTEYAVGDRVRVLPDVAPYAGKVGEVVLVDHFTRYGLSVRMDFKGFVQDLAYRPSEVELVRAEVSAPRVVTVVV